MASFEEFYNKLKALENINEEKYLELRLQLELLFELRVMRDSLCCFAESEQIKLCSSKSWPY